MIVISCRFEGDKRTQIERNQENKKKLLRPAIVSLIKPIPLSIKIMFYKVSANNHFEWTQTFVIRLFSSRNRSHKHATVLIIELDENLNLCKMNQMMIKEIKC